MHVLGSQWVHRIKLNADGTFSKLRSRVVAKGNEQEEGVDYLETYSHGDLQETVYMKQPAGFVDQSKPNHVWRLNKAIYGLKQSPRAWFDKFSSFLIKFGFSCSKSDPSLFVYKNYFLGIQVQHHEKGLFLCQQKYAEDLLAIASMTDCTPMPTPLPQQLTLTRPDIQFAVNYICQKMHSPTESDFHLIRNSFGSHLVVLDLQRIGYSSSHHASFTMRQPISSAPLS